MNTLSFVPVDTVFEAQFDLAQDWVDHVLKLLPTSTTYGGALGLGFNQQVLENFYPAVPTSKLHALVLNSCLEAMKEFMFSDGVGISQKKALLTYHFQHKTKITAQHHSIKEMLDQVKMSNDRTLLDNKQHFIETSLATVIKSRENLQESQKLLGDLQTGKASIDQKIKTLIMKQDNDMSSQKKEIEKLQKLSQEAQEQMTKMASHVEAYKKNKDAVDQAHLLPFTNLSYDVASFEHHLVKFWAEIVEQARLSELKALPDVLVGSPNPPFEPRKTSP